MQAGAKKITRRTVQVFKRFYICKTFYLKKRIEL